MVSLPIVMYCGMNKFLKAFWWEKIYFESHFTHQLLSMGWNNFSILKLQRLYRWSLGMHKLFHPTLYNWCNYLSMLGLKLTHVNKRGPRSSPNMIRLENLDTLLPWSHWGLNKMADILQTICPNAYSWKKLHVPIQIFTGVLFSGGQIKDWFR